MLTPTQRTNLTTYLERLAHEQVQMPLSMVQEEAGPPPIDFEQLGVGLDLGDWTIDVNVPGAAIGFRRRKD